MYFNYTLFEISSDVSVGRIPLYGKNQMKVENVQRFTALEVC